MAGRGKDTIDMLLAESFKELTLKQPIEKITIKEITDRAGVIRPTFYNHFQDKYELLEWIISTQLLKPVEPLLENDMVTEALVLLFTNIKKEKEFYVRVSRLDGQNSFESTVKACVKKTLLNVLRESSTGRQPKYAWLTPELIAEYCSQSMCCIVLTWIRSGMTVSPKELAEIYNYILTRSIADVLADL